MKLMRKILLCKFFALQIFATAALAQGEGPLEATVSLGYVGTSGNTDTTTFNTEVLSTFRTDRWTHKTKFQGLGSSENNATKAELYYLENKSDFSLDVDQYLFVKGSYTDDRFSGFDYQAAVSAGYGRYLLRRANYNLQGFAGAGYRENAVDEAGSSGEAIITVGENFDWQITDSASLVQSFTSDIGADLSVSRFEIGLVSNIIDRIATKIAFQARSTSEVPVGKKKTDTQTSVSLVYSF